MQLQNRSKDNLFLLAKQDTVIVSLCLEGVCWLLTVNLTLARLVFKVRQQNLPNSEYDFDI